MKILLTGAAGFLGSVCKRALIQSGHEVVTTDRHGAVSLRGDLARRDFAQTLPAVDWVVHAAAVQYVSDDLPLMGRRRYFERNNVVATVNLCNRYHGTGCRFLYIGTSMIYRQGQSSAIATRSPMEGQGVYSVSKLTAQRIVESKFLRWATVIPCIIGGPGRGGLFNGFVRSIMQRRVVLIPGAGTHPIHLIHVNDVASLVALVIAANGHGYFNAAAPRPLSIVQWADEIASELGCGLVRVRHVPLGPVTLLARLSGYTLLAREQVLMLTYPHVLDTSESLALGWAPSHDNARIVRDTARDISTKLGASSTSK